MAQNKLVYRTLPRDLDDLSVIWWEQE